ncbi:hypothetical protein LTR28_004458, partial [Elasticomyces elasticus]
MASKQEAPPYRPDTQGLGETPTIALDVPLCAVFAFLYLIGGVMHMSLFVRNKKAGRKFVFSGMMFAIQSILPESRLEHERI